MEKERGNWGETAKCFFFLSFLFFSWNQPKGRSSLSRQCKCFCKVQLPNVLWRLPVFIIERYLFKWTCWSFTGWEEPSTSGWFSSFQQNPASQTYWRSAVLEGTSPWAHNTQWYYFRPHWWHKTFYSTKLYDEMQINNLWAVSISSHMLCYE